MQLRDWLPYSCSLFPDLSIVSVPVHLFCRKRVDTSAAAGSQYRTGGVCTLHSCLSSITGLEHLSDSPLSFKQVDYLKPLQLMPQKS